MHLEWKSFLAGHNANIVGEQVRDFGDPTAERRGAHELLVADLSHRNLVLARGADALTFLNGQLTNDLRALDHQRSLLAAHCTPQGRMLALARVFRRADAYAMELPRALTGELIGRLRKYLLRSKVALELADDLVLLGFSGPEAGRTLAEVARREAPSAVNGTSTRDEVTMLRIPGKQERYEIVAPVERARELWTALVDRGARAVGPAVWEWLDIEAGLPSVQPGTQEMFVPQTANLDLVDGVSFTKGCYPGQEIVARVHYLGRLKERMFRLHLAEERDVSIGDPIYSDDLPGQATGRVVNAQRAPEGGTDLLGVVHWSSASAGWLHLGTPDGPHLAIRPLPYAVPGPAPRQT